MSSGIITDKASSIYGTDKIMLIFLIVFREKRDKFYLIEKRSSFCLVVISSSYHMSTENCRKYTSRDSNDDWFSILLRFTMSFQIFLCWFS